MKTTICMLFVTLLCLVTVRESDAQTGVLFDDPAKLLSESTQTSFFSKLQENDIEVLFTLDFSKRCEYYYIEMTRSGDQISMRIYDCHRQVLGVRHWTSRLLTLSDEDQATRLAIAVVDIIEQTGLSPEATEQPARPRADTRTEEKPAHDQHQEPVNHHVSRHFFMPSSFNLQKGELYYSTLYFLAHDFQYGITNNFSIGMGSTLGLYPFYITPKVELPIDDFNRFSLGTMVILGTWGVDLFGNLGYVTYTAGDQFRNITLGAGHLYVRSYGYTEANTVVFNLATMYRISDHIYFVSENYFNTRMVEQWNEVVQRENILFGMTGFRFINKTKDISAFQFGLGYFYWGDSYDSERFIIPTVSYVRKLGRRI